MEHPCAGCTSHPVQGAIWCPSLGVIAKGRCRKLRGLPELTAFARLYGLEKGSHNRRKVIRISDNIFGAAIGSELCVQHPIGGHHHIRLLPRREARPKPKANGGVGLVGPERAKGTDSPMVEVSLAVTPNETARHTAAATSFNGSRSPSSRRR